MSSVLTPDLDVTYREGVTATKANAAALWERHHSSAIAYAYAISRRVDDLADDLVAEAFARILASDVEPRDPLGYWLVAIRNVWNDHSRREGTRLERETAAHRRDPVAVGPDDAIVAATQSSAVVATMAKLPPRSRRVLWDTIVAERTPIELADEYGLSPNAIAACAYRARAQFRAEWGNVA